MRREDYFTTLSGFQDYYIIDVVLVEKEEGTRKAVIRAGQDERHCSSDHSKRAHQDSALESTVEERRVESAP